MSNKLLTALCLLMVVFQSYAQDDKIKNSEFHLDENYEVKSTGKIDLNTDDAKVFVIGSNRSDVHVKIDRVVETKGWSWGDKKFDVDVETRDGNLYISDKEWGNQSMVGYIREEYVIKIEAPYSISLYMKGDDDDYSITSVNGDIHLELDDGDVEITDCAGPSFYFDLDDGDIVMRGGAGELTLKMDDGDFEVRDARFTSIEARVDDGDIGLETSLQDDGYYRFQIEDGSMELIVTEGGGVFDIRHDDGSVRYDKSFDLLEQDENYTNLKLPGGSANVKISGDDMSVRLSSGRIN